jgi:hypothetical protein
MDNESQIATVLSYGSQWAVQLTSPSGKVIVAMEQEAQQLADHINSNWHAQATGEAAA